MHTRACAQIGLALLLIILITTPVSALPDLALHEKKVVVVYAREDAPNAPLIFMSDSIVAAEMEPSKIIGTRPIQIIQPIISLGRSRFDPASSPDNGRWAGPGLYLIQFRGPVGASETNTLQNLGMKVLDYVPNLAYLVWIDEDVMGELLEWDYVRAMVKYKPETKISPKLDDPRAGSLILALGVDGKMSAPPEAIARSVGGTLISSYEVAGYIYIRFSGDPVKARALAGREDISWIETFNMITVEDERSAQVVAGNIPVAPGYKAWLQSKGVDGTGISVGHVDTGLYSAHLDVAGRVIDINSNGQDGSGHGTHTAGICCGNASSNKDDGSGYQYGQGMAPNAKIISITKNKLSDKENMQKIAENNGSITTFSWNTGYSGAYGAVEREFDTYVLDASSTLPGEQPLSITFSAGNQGPDPGTITAPHCAKDIIAVGATMSPRNSPPDIEQIVDYSSRGPCEDGRLKPEIAAPGDEIYSAKAGTTDQHVSMGGTSMACPHIAGATALVQQYFRDKFGSMPMPSLVKAMHVNGANDMTGVAAGIPNMSEGWGRVNLNNEIENGIDMYYENEKNSVSTGSNISLNAAPSDTSKPFKITLVWSDKPGASGANPALVNDLDLVVEGSEGTYYGNNFTNGWSNTGGNPDNLNPIESVHVKNPTASYTIRIVGKNVPQGPQKFSLVIYNTKLQSAWVKLAKPLGGETYKGGQSVQLSWSSNGPVQANSGELSFSKDSGSTWVSIVSGQPANGSYSWTAQAENTATAMVRIQLKDLQGGTLESKSKEFTIDSTPPTSKVDALPQYTLTKAFNVSFTSSDTLSGISETQLFHRKGSVGQFTPGPKSNASPMQFTGPTDGRFEFYTIAADKAGNNESAKSTMEAFTIIDTVKPAVTQTAPVNNSKGLDTNLTVKITFSEGMNQSEVKATVTPPVTPGSPTWGVNDTEFYFKLNNLAQKTEYTVSLTGKDIAGWDLAPFFIKFTTIEISILPATVEGTITDASTSDPIQGATIKAFKSGTTNIVNTTTTDSAGQYSFNLPPGSYDLNVSKSGYISDQTGITLTEGATETRDFDLFKVGPVTGTVIGTVRDKAGKPITGATVTTDNATATTNSKGSYTLILSPGDHNISAKAKDYSTEYALVTVKGRQTTTHDFTLTKASTPPSTDTLAGTMPLLIAVIAIIVVAVIMVLLLLMRKRKKGSSNACPYCQTPLPMGAIQCARCGAQVGNLQSGAQFGPPSEYQPDASIQGYPQQEYAQEGYPPPEQPPYG